MEKSDFNPIFKARYLNNGEGSLQNNIKRIKSLNKHKASEKHKTFNKTFHKSKNDENEMQKMSQTEVKFYGNIGGLKGLENLKLKDTYGSDINMNKTNYNNTKYLNTMSNFETSNNFYPTLFTQTSQKNTNNPVEKNNKNHFMKTSTSNFNKTSSTFQPPKNLTDEDLGYLVSFYHMNEHGKMENAFKKPYITKESKHIMYEKLNIKKEKNEKEDEIITAYIHNRDKKVNNFERTMDKFNKFEFSIFPTYFTNPHKSLRKLKKNSQIFETLMNMRTVQQIEAYRNLYENEIENFIKVNQMPKIRETKTNKTITDRLLKSTSEKVQPQSKKSKNYDFDDEDFSLENKKAETVDVASKLAYTTKQLSREQLLENIEFATSFEGTIHKPNARKQFTLSIEGNTIFLFGGINSERLFDMWYCNIKENYKWKQIEIDEDDAPVPRAGHTAVIYRRDIYIYGGSTPREYFKPREDILVFSTLTNSFYTERAYNRLEAGWRRNHIAIGVGGFMFVHGGLDEADRVLSDCLTFDFTKMLWSKLEFKGNKPCGLAHHSAELVVEADRMHHPGFNIYKSPDIPMNKNVIKRIKHEGIYIFGGWDENRNLTNEVRILKVGKKPCEWFYPKIQGIPPVGRANASLNYYQDLNILIIHGGRNDRERPNILSDIFVLDLENLVWIKAEFNSMKPIERTEHGAVVHGDTLLILGGNNSKTFNSFDFLVVHLDLYNKRKSEKAKTFVDNNTSILKNKSHNTTKESFFHHRDRNTSNQLNFSSNINFNKDVIPFIEPNKLQDILKLTNSGKENMFNDDDL